MDVEVQTPLNLKEALGWLECLTVKVTKRQIQVIQV